MAPNVIIRDARPDEVDDVGSVILTAYAQFEAAYPADSWARYYDMVGRMQEHFDAGEVIVAELDGRIIGTVTFYPNGSKSGQGEWPEGWAGVLRLAVLPGHRGLGLGKLLTEECIRRCRVAGISTLALHTTDWMPLAKSMYERMGFVREPAFDFIPRSGIYAYGYKLDVSAPIKLRGHKEGAPVRPPLLR